jgi:hypothetical protein
MKELNNYCDRCRRYGVLARRAKYMRRNPTLARHYALKSLAVLALIQRELDGDRISSASTHR